MAGCLPQRRTRSCWPADTRASACVVIEALASGLPVVATRLRRPRGDRHAGVRCARAAARIARRARRCDVAGRGAELRARRGRTLSSSSTVRVVGRWCRDSNSCAGEALRGALGRAGASRRRERGALRSSQSTRIRAIASTARRASRRWRRRDDPQSVAVPTHRTARRAVEEATRAAVSELTSSARVAISTT